MSVSEISFSASYEILPPSFFRGHISLIILKQGDAWILGRKEIYPDGIARLVGGGVEDGEELVVAAARELFEEVGVRVPTTQLVPLTTVRCSFEERSTGKKPVFQASLFFCELSSDTTLHPDDDLDDLWECSTEEFREIIGRFSTLNPDLKDSKTGFRWADYGEVYAFIHKLALDLAEDFLKNRERTRSQSAD